jgi:hypothetical protein
MNIEKNYELNIELIFNRRKVNGQELTMIKKKPLFGIKQKR